jgi:hypothetical protein
VACHVSELGLLITLPGTLLDFPGSSKDARISFDETFDFYLRPLLSVVTASRVRLPTERDANAYTPRRAKVEKQTLSSATSSC